MYNSYSQRLPGLRSAHNASKNAGLDRQARPNLQVVYGGCHEIIRCCISNVQQEDERA
jgi:hypothetical protein